MRSDSGLSSPSNAPSSPSRRSILAAGFGGLAGLVVGALGRPAPAAASAGSTMIIGSETNNAGSANTQLATTSSVVAFKLLQQGPGTALMGYATPATGATRGVYGRVDSPDGYGVQARSAGTFGLGAAIQAIGGNNTGIEASTDIATRYAVHGTNNAPTLNGGMAIFGQGNANSGVWGTSSGAYGVHGYSSTNIGVHGQSYGSNGVYGYSDTAAGVYGSSAGNYGLQGLGPGAGVYGSSATQFGVGVSGVGGGSDGHGVVGSISQNSGNASGIYGGSGGSSSYAGYFEGHVAVTGTLSKGGGSFRIDHPLAPATRILQHSFVESPDMLNIYNGVVTADGSGAATVELPAWFMALNRDFRYGLTAIGRPAPDLHVKAKVAAGRFTIAGAQPGQEVSWQLTGIRRDAWANANRIAVELDKPAAQRGLYLHPAAHGKPLSKGVDYPMQQRIAAMRDEVSATASAG